MRTEEAIKNGHSKDIGKQCNEADVRARAMVFNATFNNISVISYIRRWIKLMTYIYICINSI